MTVRSSTDRPRIGLALGSGGIRGLAHIGVLKVLRENRIPIHCIAGSSIGAWVGSHYALFEDMERLEQLTVEHREDKLKAMFELTLKGGLIKGNKLGTLLDDWLMGKSFADTRLPLGVVATDIISGEAVVITEGSLTPAVQASMAIPSLFKPVYYQDRYLLDGAIVNPVPVDVARHLGAEIVIAVNLDNYVRPAIFLSEEVESVTKVSGRALDLLSHQLARHCIEQADVVIEPNNAYEGLSSWSGYFWRDVGPEHVGLGADAAREALPQIMNLLDNYDG